jgi:peroxiredoxin
VSFAASATSDRIAGEAKMKTLAVVCRVARSVMVMTALVAALGTAERSNAGQFNTVLSLGDQAPEWKSLPGVDDKSHSLADLKDKDVVVVVFTCNSCPYAVDHEARLIEFQRNFGERGVALVAINVNKVEEDRLDAMKARAREKGFTFPYLYDETQQIAKDYGARYTPEFFVLNRARQIIYMGSMDDSPDGTKVQKRYLELAVNAALEGSRPETGETVPIGCAVRYQRQRRQRP